MFRLSGFCCKATSYPGSSLTSVSSPQSYPRYCLLSLRPQIVGQVNYNSQLLGCALFFFPINRSTQRECHVMTETHRGENDHMKLEAEIGVLLPWTKEHLGSPEAGRETWGSSPESSENVLPRCHPDFRLLTSRAVREYISLLHPTQSVTLRYNSPRKLIQVVWMLNEKKKSYVKCWIKYSTNSIFKMSLYVENNVSRICKARRLK